MSQRVGSERQRIAVVGGGVAGIVASYLLSQRHEVTLFERNEYLGGHTNTIVVSDGDKGSLAVDTGFIVLNDRTYPLFRKFLDTLSVPVRFSDMNFSVHCEQTGLQYASRDLNSIFAQRANLVNPRFLRMLAEMPRFWRLARRALQDDRHLHESLASFLSRNRFSRGLMENFILPLGASIWSSPLKGLEEFPAITFIQFFENHGWLSLANQPRWQTVVGGSFAYVKAFARTFNGRLELNHKVKRVERLASGKVEVHSSGQAPQQFDHAVLAAHANESLALLSDPSAEEKQALAAWTYSNNHTVLHTDISFMPPERRAWASWNYRKELGESGEKPVSVTYDMNALQGFTSPKRYLVTLNPRRQIERSAIIREIDYTHPVYTIGSVASQTKLSGLNGERNTWFCGSYFGYGFHEDAVRSAVTVAERFGCAI